MPIIDQALVLPLFIYIALVAVIAVKMYRARVAAIKSGAVTIDQIALDRSLWPANVQKLQNNMSNLFEVPPLFVAAVLLALMVGLKSWVFVVLAWIFILSRIAHSAIHITSNKVQHRAQSFMVGFFVVLGMWGYLFVHIFF